MILTCLLAREILKINADSVSHFDEKKKKITKNLTVNKKIYNV